MKIHVDNLSIVLSKKKILNQLNCTFDKGIYGLMGANGSGKTTFIRALLGLYSAQSGSVKVYDDNENEKKISHLHIGYLPQTFDVFKDLTVYDQLKYFYILKEINSNSVDMEIDRVLELTNLSDKVHEKCKNLSGGMVRRLGIAQALLGTPKLLVLDEPTAGLDPNERFRFKEMIRQFKLNIPIIISTHIVEDISTLCTDLIYLNNGEIKYQGTISDLVKMISNKVFNCSTSQLSLIKEKVIVLHEHEDKVKIITDCNLDYDFLIREDVTLEDAYLYLSQQNI